MTEYERGYRDGYAARVRGGQRPRKTPARYREKMPDGLSQAAKVEWLHRDALRVPAEYPEMDDCLVADINRDDAGYGTVLFLINGKVLCARLHRLAYAVSIGVSVFDLGRITVHQMCDNKRCSNDKHLIGGTYSENSKDIWRRGRNPHAKLRGARVYGQASRWSMPPGRGAIQD